MLTVRNSQRHIITIYSLIFSAIWYLSSGFPPPSPAPRPRLMKCVVRQYGSRVRGYDLGVSITLLTLWSTVSLGAPHRPYGPAQDEALRGFVLKEKRI